MSLSANVARGGPAKTTPTSSGKLPPSRKPRTSPFGGMNVTDPPRAAAHRYPVSAAEQKRGGRYAKQHGRSSGAEGREKRDPMKALKMQRRLANISYEKRGRVKETIQLHPAFEGLDLLPVVKESIAPQALGGMNDIAPTPIQSLAIPALLGTEDGKARRRKRKDVGDGSSRKKEMQTFLLAAETGSGKTLAYVLPVIDALKRAEKREAEAARLAAAQQAREEAATKPARRLFELEAPQPEISNAGRPRAIILVPSAELVDQVGRLVKSLSHTVKFRAALISSSLTPTMIRSRLFAPAGIDVLVSTPHLLASIATADPHILSRASHLVIDEADSLLDRSFAPITGEIIDRATPSLEQLILCSATIPRSLDGYLQKRFPDMRRLVTPNLHAIPRRVQLSVVDIDKVPYQGNRDLACAQTVWAIGKEAMAREDVGETRIVVFVNERETATSLATYLRSKGIDAVAWSRDSEERTTPRQHAETLAAFTGAEASPRPRQQSAPVPIPSSDPRGPAPATQLQGTKVLVTTDLGSRGLDTVLVRHVILYDVPHSSIDFIHRLGRVGRMGRRGRGVVLVGKGDRRDIVKEIRGGMFRGSALI